MYNILTLLLLITVYSSVANAAALSHLDQGLIQMINKQCKAKFNINEDAKILYNVNEMPKNEAEVCYFDCGVEKLDMVKNGQLDRNIFTKVYQPVIDEYLGGDEAKLEIFYQKCQKEVEKRSQDKCGNGAALIACTVGEFNP